MVAKILRSHVTGRGTVRVHVRGPRGGGIPACGGGIPASRGRTPGNKPTTPQCEDSFVVDIHFCVRCRCGDAVVKGTRREGAVAMEMATLLCHVVLVVSGVYVMRAILHFYLRFGILFSQLDLVSRATTHSAA